MWKAITSLSVYTSLNSLMLIKPHNDRGFVKTLFEEEKIKSVY